MHNVTDEIMFSVFQFHEDEITNLLTVTDSVHHIVARHASIVKQYNKKIIVIEKKTRELKTAAVTWCLRRSMCVVDSPAPPALRMSPC